ncbi:hypothetical protein [Pelovirga terrestris]|uniref:Uncharacterized protein n=1 Tax=Pelovirga terrestris TaxID=2771352 RepID=A0A8J6QR72_9BACT|nr:hypothetical protein [Pelovirga terrestris]MBD1400688.1 hypothetical protein [Pelovirga terrestris]
MDMRNNCCVLDEMAAQTIQKYDYRVENDIFFERVSGQICLAEALYLSTNVQRTLRSQPVRYRVVDFLDSRISAIDQKSIDQLFSTKLLRSSGKKLKLLLIIKDNDDLIYYVIENIKSFSSECLTLVFDNRREPEHFIENDQVYSMANCS